MRRRITYANLVATLALVFAMSGGALAASHFLISSTKQLSPKVLKALKGRTGAQGAPGATGAAGAVGTAGKEGSQGKEGSAGKEGQRGKEGPQGAPGTARAYAAVSGTGVLETARSKNIESVKHEGPGIYCIALSPAAEASGASTVPVAVPDAKGESGFVSSVNAYVETQPVTCKEGKLEILMRQMKTTGGVLEEANADSGFTVVVP